MQRKIIEFSLGAFFGVMLVMTFAYMSVEIHNIGPVTIQRVADVQPSLLLSPPQLIDAEQTPIIQMIVPLPETTTELQP